MLATAVQPLGKQLIVPALTMIPIMGIMDPRMGIRHAANAIGEALYGRTRQAVLRLFFGQPDRRFLQKEVIQRIGLGSGAVQRELERLHGLSCAGHSRSEDLRRRRRRA